LFFPPLKQPSLSPRRLCLFNTTTGTALRELNFLTSVLAVRLNKKRQNTHSFIFFKFVLNWIWWKNYSVVVDHCRLVVVLQEKTYIYDLNTLAILDAIDTVPNVKGETEDPRYVGFRGSFHDCFYSYLCFITKLMFKQKFLQNEFKQLWVKGLLWLIAWSCTF
jgi:hypothetical protein